MRKSVFLPLFLTLLFGFVCPPLVRGESPSFTPPAVYAEKLKDRLTPLEALLAAEAPAGEEAEAGVVLLDEEYYWIEPDGRRLVIEHFAARALTEGGAEGLARTVRQYDRSRSRLHLALARTVHADGRSQEVNPAAVFLQTPQRNADDAIYDDSAELVVQFSGVAVGSTVEWITVLEETRTRIPGEFTAFLGMASGWPVRSLVRRLDMAEEIAARLQVNPLGSGVPEPRRTVADGRVTLTWTRRALPMVRGETDRAPVSQSGPGIYLTTLPDWDAFLRWYVPLAERQAVAGDALTAEVKEWTKDAKSPREIVDILTEKAAQEVRYAGLEFGACDLEPHPASSVWEHRYGDCKDKAVLLCTMLRLCDIKAWPVLVNTAHAGRVERRSPDFRHFDHAIAMAELPDGPVFLDPTLSGSPAGMLSPADCDREVLLVREPATWLRTPAQRAGRYGVDIEATLGADGGLSGWATLRADGYIGSLYAEYERTGTRDGLKRRLTRQMEGRFPGAAVVDVKPSRTVRETGEYEVSGYFTVPATGTLSVRFPWSAGMLPDPGDTTGRQTEMTQWLETNRMESVITVPDGYVAALPSPYVVESAWVEGSARWVQDGNALRATLDLRALTARIPAADCEAFGRLMAGLRAWISQPVTLSAGEGARPVVPEPGEELTGFPAMPTGEGQLALVEEKYPLNGNRGLRRKALERTLTLFPGDVLTRFSAEVQLAFLEVIEKKPAEALRRLKGPLESGRGGVPAEDAAFGDYVQAMALEAAGEKAEALALFTRLGGNEELSGYRRAWSLVHRSQLLAETDTPAAVAAVQTALGLENGIEEQLFDTLVWLRFGEGGGGAEAFLAELKDWLAKEPAAGAQVLVSLAITAEEWAADRQEDAGKLCQVLRDAGAAERGAECAAALEKAEGAADSRQLRQRIARDVLKWMLAHAELVPVVDVDSSVETAEQWSEEIRKVSAQDQAGDDSLGWTIRYVTRFADADDFDVRLRSVAALADFRQRQRGEKSAGPLLLFALEQLERLPADADGHGHVDGMFLRARMLERTGDVAGAEKLLEFLASGESPEGFRATAWDRLGTLRRAAGNAAGAAESWEKMAAWPEWAPSADGLVRACRAWLEAGEPDKALAVAGKLRALPEATRKKAELAEAADLFLTVTEKPDAARAWWAYEKTWWPLWEKLEARLGPPAAADPAVFITSLLALGREFGQANTRKDRPAMNQCLQLLAAEGRWFPVRARDLLSVQMLAGALPDEAAQEFRALCQALAGAPLDPSAEEWGQFQIFSMAVELDHGDAEVCQKSAEALAGRKDLAIVFRTAVTRLRMMAAAKTGRDREGAAAAAETFLAGPEADAERHLMVTVLADLYQKMGRTGDARAMLGREIGNPQCAPGVQRLKAILTALDAPDTTRDPARLAAVLREVMEFPWWDYVLPGGLKDPETGDPDKWVDPDTEKPAARRLKVLILLCEGEPTASQGDGAVFCTGLLLPTLAPDAATAARWLQAVLEAPLTDQAKARIYYAFLREAFNLGRLEVIRQAARPDGSVLAVHLSKSGVTFVNAAWQLAACPPGDAAALTAVLEAVVDGGVDGAVPVLGVALERLADLGRDDLVDEWMGKVKAADLPPTVRRHLGSWQVGMLRKMEAARTGRALHGLLRKKWLSLFPDPITPVPSADLIQAHRASVAEMLAWYDRRVREGTLAATSLREWFRMLGSLPIPPKGPDAALEMLRVAVANAPTDEVRAEVLREARGVVDFDEAEVRAELRKFIEPLATMKDAEASRDAAAVLSLVLDLRSGAIDCATGRGRFRSLPEEARGSALSRLLNAALATGDKAEIRRCLDQARPDELMDPALLGLTMPAWRMLDRKAEAEVGMETLRAALRAGIAEVWSGEVPAGFYLASLLEAAGDPALVPDAFLRDVPRLWPDAGDNAAFFVRAWALREDWPACLEAAQTVLKTRPVDYDYHFMAGKALVKLGRKAEAIPHLRAFLTHCPAERETPEARALMTEAGGDLP